MMFPMCFQRAPQVVPPNVPNSISLLSQMVCPKFNSHVYKLKKVHYMEQMVVQRGASVGEC
jgi:hypothetical protein